nr:heavy metal translocating P-type ATPase [Sneathiella chungangensis]
MTSAEKETATDPVCGMTVTLNAGKPNHVHNDETYHFCSQKCHDRFVADPFFYLSGGHKKHQKSQPKATQYTCPMHPEIIRDQPGDCPKCGMALEPMGAPGADDGPNPELIDFTRRFWVSTALALPLLVLTMGEMVGLPFDSWIGARLSTWIQLALATPVVLWAAIPFFKRGWSSIINRSPNMWTLIMLGVAAAYAFSLVATLVPGSFPSSFRTAAGIVPVYFEAAAVIIALVFLGQVLELRAREQTGSAIKALLDLAPKTARRINSDGSEYDVPLENILEGDKLRIRPGDSVPVDGVVLEGHSAVDESMISGEPVPVEKSEGDKLTGGTLNGTGTLIMKAELVGADTMLSKIVEMVASAQRSRAPIQGLADKVAAWFVPSVVVVAILSFLIWAVFGPSPAMIHAIVAAVSVLIIACPCALGLATPMSIMTATGRGATAGVLIRDAEALERFASVDVLVVDKTGTLTEGRPKLTDVIALQTGEDDALLTIAAALEKGSEHPLAEAIVSGAEARGLKIPPAGDFNAVTGKGVEGTVEGRSVALGNRAMMEEKNLDPGDFEKRAADLQQEGKTVMYVARDNAVAGIVAVADPVKETTEEAIRALHELGIKIIMATGDNERTAKAVASRLGIDDVRADVLPADKKALIEELRETGHRIAMAGDGVNDAPALAAADVGIAMGTGADVAVESAGITLVKGDLTGIVRARKLAVGTLRNIKENLFFAFAYNGAGIPIAAGILYPFTGTLLSPMIAAAAMSLSSVSVISNALRLRTIKLN